MILANKPRAVNDGNHRFEPAPEKQSVSIRILSYSSDYLSILVPILPVKPRRPESPCNRRCTLDPATDICLGCYRSLQEILGWANYSARQRRVVLEGLEERRNEYALRRMGQTPNKD